MTRRVVFTLLAQVFTALEDAEKAYENAMAAADVICNSMPGWEADFCSLGLYFLEHVEDLRKVEFWYIAIPVAIYEMLAYHYGNEGFCTVAHLCETPCSPDRSDKLVSIK